MLGFGAIGQFAIGQVDTTAQAEVITPDKWFNWLSEPVRFKKGLRSSYQQTLAFNPQPFVSFGWFGNLTLPVRQRPRNPAALYPTFQPGFKPEVAYSWRANLSEPVRFKKGLRAPYHPPFVFPPGILPNPTGFIQGWYTPYSEPKRFKRGLGGHYQQFLAYHPRMLPTPNVTAIMAALETNSDIALFAIHVVSSNEPDTAAVAAAVSIEEIGSGSATSVVEVEP